MTLEQKQSLRRGSLRTVAHRYESLEGSFREFVAFDNRDQLCSQIRRRSDRRRVRDNRTRQWAARSVWSEVCAKDLGLIVPPITSSTNRVEVPFTAAGGRDKIGKRTASRGVKKKSIFHALRRTSSCSTQIRSAYFVNCPCRESSHVRRVASKLNDGASLRSHEFRGSNDPSVPRNALLYDPFGIARTGNRDVYEREPDDRLGSAAPRSFPELRKARSRDDDSSLENDDRVKERVAGSKAVGGVVERVARKLGDREHRGNKPAKRASRRGENNRDLGKSIGTTKESRGRARKKVHGEISSPRVDEKSARSVDEKLAAAKNDYENSDIDESLLVDPFTDLPRSLLETIDEGIDLTKPYFDVIRDSSFGSDEALSSAIETLDAQSRCLDDLAFGISTRTVRNSTYGGGKARKVNFVTNAPKDGIENAREKSRGTDGGAAKEAAALVDKDQDGRETTIPERRRRSANGAVVAAGGTAGSYDEDRRNVCGKASLPEKRRRSADDAVVGSRAGWIGEQRKNDDCGVSARADSFGRVTRLSARNSTANRDNRGETRGVGTIVWGNCKGWWPAFIVDPADVGMFSQPEKTWVCWIWEYKISHLRSKSQIQSFSNCLRERMIETLASRRNSGDPYYRACLETIELINEEILRLGPLTKPHHAWAEKHLASLENIDRLILHPYPSYVKPRLDELRRANFKATAKYLSELKEAEKIPSTRMSVRNATTGKKATLAAPVAGHLPLMKQKPGVITWAKIMGQVWWPAVIVDYRDCGMKEPSFGCQWIVWYGDNTMSQVNHRFFLSFENGISLMRDYAKNCRRECYRRGVVDAARDYCCRVGYKAEEWSIDEVFAWFETNDAENSDPLSRTASNSLPGIPGNFEISQRYPTRIVEALRKHRRGCTVAAAREHAIRESDIVERVEARGVRIEEVCLMCLEDCGRNDNGTGHPFFVGKLCEGCSEKYKPTVHAYGDDGKCFFCTICAGSDTVVMCDGDDCPRVYCTACIKYLVAPRFYEDIMRNDPWLCFLCDVSEASTCDGFLVPRRDWNERVARLFRSNVNSIAKHLELYDKSDGRKIRVLSLFDGISAGLVVLKKLAIQIDVYYASEIDPDAEMVSSAHHGREIERLGDVRLISEEKIRGILPIDLLIGGSPCNDLSLVNPLRLGLHDPNGTGILFFEYCRIKNLLEKLNGRHFFWLFENVASMPSKYRTEINENLGREPELIDSANYSPQHRPRLYWSNLPSVSFPLSTQDLEDVLTPNCNRHALVKKIRTVTTRVNSLRQGRDALKPILMNETNDTLWITELEEIFGFPKHYTDVKNLCATKRQKLIALSWSVQTITEIMRPLCNFFSTRSDEST